MPSANKPGTAALNGRLWGARAHDWANVQEGQSLAAYEAVFAKFAWGADAHYCDAGCGAGMAALLAEQSESHARELVYSAAGLIVQSLLLACTAVADMQLGSMGEGFLGPGAAVFAAVNLALLVANAWPSAGSDGLRIARALREWRGSVQ